MRRRLGAWSAAIVVAACAAANAAEGPLRGGDPGALLAEATALGLPVTITADSLSFEEDTGIAVAEGNVEVAVGSRVIRAEKIRYDTRTQEAELAANVRYFDAGDEFSFDRIRINFDTEKGALEKGRIRLGTNNYQIASDLIEKTGRRTFFVRKGTLTTCPCCDPAPDWSFEVDEARVTLDGYATGRNVVMRVRGVPVLWFPYAAFPVKLTRQSGLLMPVVASSPSRGFTVSLPYYWAINRWSDATVTLDWMSRRGLRPEAEYRYALNPRSEGELHVTAYEDRVTGRTRSRVYGKNVFRSAGEITANARVDLSSDERYYVDLVDEDILRTGRHVPSRAFASVPGSSSGNSVAVTWVQDIQGAPSDNVVQRLPEYSGTWLPRAIGRTGIYGSGEAQAVYFHRRAGERSARGRGYVELARPIALHPSVLLTPYVFADGLESRISEGRDGSRDAGRVVPGAGALVRTGIRRDYSEKSGRVLVHAVSAEAGFRWVPVVGQADIPIVDQWSRIAPRSQWTASLDQRLLRVGGDAGPVELASLEVQWAADLRSRGDRGNPYVDPLSPYAGALRDEVDIATGFRREGTAHSDVLARLRAAPAPGWNLGGEALFDAAEGRLATAAVSGGWERGPDAKAAVEYRLTKDLAEDVSGVVALRPIRPVGLRTEAHYSIRNGVLTDGSAAVTLYPASDCWSVGLVVGRRTLPAETSFKMTFSLRGIGSVGR